MADHVDDREVPAVPPPHLVLVHSPLVGPDTWQPVAEVLRGLGHAVTVPDLTDDDGPPWWRRHAEAVTSAVRDRGDDAPIVLAAHSGAGQLLDHLAVGLQADGHDVVAALRVDAGPATDGRSRLAQLRDESPERADDLDRRAVEGRPFPDWTEQQLADLVPDAARRRRLVAGLRPRPHGYWTEIIPAAQPHPSVPCAVLLLSDGYASTVSAAARRGWPLHDLATANHFHLLADPDAVADAMLALVDDLLAPDATRDRAGQ